MPGMSFTLVLFIASGKKTKLFLPIPRYVVKAQLREVFLHYIAYSLELNQEHTQSEKPTYKTDTIRHQNFQQGLGKWPSS